MKTAVLAKTKWHTIGYKEAVKKLESNISKGLTTKEASERLKKLGRNELPEDKASSQLVVFLHQFKSPLILILLVAGILTFALGEYTDSIVIWGAMMLNTIIGYVQERKASKALEKLNKVLEQKALVIRDGKELEVFQHELVPGDILELTPGNKVSADARIIESWELRVNEAPLTGEWIASLKKDVLLGKETPIADRDNMVYMGGMVETGTGKAIVTGTGTSTELGNVASLVDKVKEERTPYQKRLRRFSWILGAVVAFLASFIFLEGTLLGADIVEMFTLAVAIAVAAVPEGLPIAMTIILAIGMQRILSKKGLVRKLSAAETLGSTSVIATDKTLTLTEGKMEVEEIYTLDISQREEVLVASALANEAFIENPDEVFKKWVLRGRPTDIALIKAATEAGISKTEWEKKLPLLLRIPFSTETKYIASFHRKGKGIVAYLSGAPERILEQSNLSTRDRKVVEKKLEKLTQKGFRVVGLASTSCQDLPAKEHALKQLKNLSFIGFIALKDPLRRGVKVAIEATRKAGIRTIMATGDHLLTAAAVASEIGMKVTAKQMIEGKELDTLSDKELQKRLTSIQIYARVNPAHKLRIISAWQERGDVIAMTGDGINDAPALKRADIGLALGSGTDVAKEVSDLILLTDNFSIIPAAIREGRVILDNMRKVVTYLLSGAFTETILIGTALVAGFPLPITALQILWINLIEDGLPGIALTLEEAEKNVMDRPPGKPNAPLLTGEMKFIILAIGVITDLILLGLFFWLLKGPYELAHIQTLIFVALGLDSLFYVFSLRSLRKNIWEYNPFSNRMLTVSVAIGIIALAAAIYIPLFQNLLHTVPLTLFDWILLTGLALFNVLLIEAAKWYFIDKAKSQS